MFSIDSSAMIDWYAQELERWKKENPDTAEDIDDSLPDFMSVMMDVLLDHKTRLVGKLGIRYKSEFDKLDQMEAEEKKEEVKKKK